MHRECKDIVEIVIFVNSGNKIEDALELLVSLDFLLVLTRYLGEDQLVD